MMISACLRLLPVILLVLMATWTISCNTEEDDPKVEKNEDLYINEVYASSGEDWIELYNATDETKDLTGYRIYDNVDARYSLPAGTTIAAKGFLVLICDDGNTGLHTNFKLSSLGETVYLENSSGEVIDRVEFPSLDDGHSYARFPDGSANLGTTGLATRGVSNGEHQGALFTDVTRIPLVPSLDEPVNVQATIVTNAGIKSVQLHYRIAANAFTTIQMTSAGGGIYQAVIPAFNATGRVEYYITAENNNGVISVTPFEAPEDPYYFLLNTDALPSLYINEFMAFNSSCCPDTDGGLEEFDDWIEIYNASDEAIDIGGMYLSDNLENPFKSRIPDSDPAMTTIPAGGFLRLWADEDGSQGPLHLNFQLSTAGETIGLFYIDGRMIHSHEFGNQQENRSTGLSADGGTSWVTFTSPTPGASNQ